MVTRNIATNKKVAKNIMNKNFITILHFCESFTREVVEIDVAAD